MCAGHKCHKPSHDTVCLLQANSWIYPKLNNGVYRSGFATSQDAHEEGCRHGPSVWGGGGASLLPQHAVMARSWPKDCRPAVSGA